MQKLKPPKKLRQQRELKKNKYKEVYTAFLQINLKRTTAKAPLITPVIATSANQVKCVKCARAVTNL